MHFNLFVTLQYGAGRGPGAGKVPHLLYSAGDLSLFLSLSLAGRGGFDLVNCSMSFAKAAAAVALFVAMLHILDSLPFSSSSSREMHAKLCCSHCCCLACHATFLFQTQRELSCLCIYLHFLGGQRDRLRG